MTFMRKLKKLLRDPQAYLQDSRKPLLREFGLLLSKRSAHQESASKKSQLINRNLPARTQAMPTQDVVSVSQTKTSKLSLSGAAAMEPIFKNETNNDLWRWHKEWNRHEEGIPGNHPDFYLLPLGIPAIDRETLHNYSLILGRPRIAPVWMLASPNQDIDDIEFFLKGSPLIAARFAEQLLKEISGKGATHLILPYDATNLTRSLAIAARRFSITTICNLTDCPALLNLYDSALGNLTTISDWVNLAGQDGVAKYPHIDPNRAFIRESGPDEKDSQTRPNPESIAEQLQIDVSSRVLLLLLPPVQYGATDSALKGAIEHQARSVLENAGETDHLVVIGKKRKYGLMSPSTVQLLKRKYRKTVLTYDEVDDLAPFVDLAAVIYAPRGYFPVGALGQRPVHYFDLDIQDARDIKQREDNNTLPCTAIYSTPPDIKNLRWNSVNLTNSEKVILDRVLSHSSPKLDVIAVPDPLSNRAISDGRQKYLLTLLNSNYRVYGADDFRNALFSELFIQWGAEPNEAKERPEIFRSLLSRPRLYIEDGFIRSRGLWTDPNEPTLSVVIDTRAVYYNSFAPSLLESILNSDFALDQAMEKRARAAIKKIVDNKISKYNYAPKTDLDLKSPKRKILLVDQKAGDMSIKYGHASRESFFEMLEEAIKLGDDCEVIIKQHPCAISGNPEEAHFTQESIRRLGAGSNVTLLAFDINPYSLINAVDEVWVVTSGMGFEALMANKKVRCFGIPFFANWQITHDQKAIARRSRRRSVEEIFYVFYILLTRYINPETKEICELEAIIDYFSESK